MKRLIMPSSTIRKLLRRGVSKEDVVDTVFKGYKNTRHHTEYWRKQIKNRVGHENAKLTKKKKEMEKTRKNKKQKQKQNRKQKKSCVRR